MKSYIKILVLSILIIASFIFITYENKIFNGNSKNVKSQYNKLHTEYLEANITENYLKNIENVTNDNYIRLVEPRQWVINNLVAHYSPRIIVKSKRRFIIEAMAFYDHINQTNENLKSNVNFLVMFAQKDNKTDKLFHKIDEAVEIPTVNINVSRFLWKLKCEIVVNTKLIDFNKTVILVTDVSEYKRLGRSVSEQDLNRLLTYQKPFIYETKEKKKPAKGHCLHVNRNLDEQRLLELKNWLSNQQKVDNDRIKIYFSDVNEKSRNEIREFISVKKWEMKIEIIDFGLFLYLFFFIFLTIDSSICIVIFI